MFGAKLGTVANPYQTPRSNCPAPNTTKSFCTMSRGSSLSTGHELTSLLGGTEEDHKRVTTSSKFGSKPKSESSNKPLASAYVKVVKTRHRRRSESFDSDSEAESGEDAFQLISRGNENQKKGKGEVGGRTANEKVEEVCSQVLNRAPRRDSSSDRSSHKSKSSDERSSSSSEDEDAIEERRRRIRARAKLRAQQQLEQSESSRSDGENDNDNAECRSKNEELQPKLKPVQLAKTVKDNLSTSSYSKASSSEDDSSSDDSSSDDSSSDDSSDEEITQKIAKPIFLPKHKRGDARLEEERLAKEAREKERQRQLQEKRIKESRMLVKESIQATMSKNEQSKDDDGCMPDDSDEVDNVEIERTNWEVREILRILRVYDQIEDDEIEQLELERRRKMTDTERIEEDERLGKFKKEKGKLNFMQRYYHKGAFYMDEDSLRDKNDVRRKAAEYAQAATGEDKFDKSKLPAVMQVKKFGMSGYSTKYKGLVHEDTTDKSAAYISVKRKRQSEDGMSFK